MREATIHHLIEKYLKKQTTASEERALLDVLLRFYNEMLIFKEERMKRGNFYQDR